MILRGVRALKLPVGYGYASFARPSLQPARLAFSRLSSSSASSSSAPPSKTLLIVYHTLTDGSRQMAQAAYEAAQHSLKESGDTQGSSAKDSSTTDDNVSVKLVKARDAGPDDLLAASAYMFVCPENLATMAGIMKDFFDRSFYPVLGKLNGRSYAVMICAGSDGEGAMRQIDRIATGWRLKRAAEGIIVCTHAQTGERCLAQKTIEDKDLERCAEMGEAMAQGLALGVF